MGKVISLELRGSETFRIEQDILQVVKQRYRRALEEARQLVEARGLRQLDPEEAECFLCDLAERRLP